MSYGDYPYPEDWENQYAAHLERQMEEQYEAYLTEQYDALTEALTNPEEVLPPMEETVKYVDSLAHQLLHVPMEENDADAATVGEYLGLLLSTLWIEADGFSGKRPFGNSSWQYDVYIAMSKAGLCELELDEDGYIDVFTDEAQIAADELVLQAIRLAYNHG